MLGNKICVTEKGLDWLSDGRNQYLVDLKYLNSRTSSLPAIKSVEMTKRQTLAQKIVKTEKLFHLTTRLEKIEKVGLRNLIIKEEDKMLTQLLKQEMKEKQKYLNILIPSIVKKTRDPQKTNNLDSRFNRSRAYTERLLQNYQSQKNFGLSNHLKKNSRGSDQEQTSERKI